VDVRTTRRLSKLSSLSGQVAVPSAAVPGYACHRRGRGRHHRIKVQNMSKCVGPFPQRPH
jgi:hypothetical protein